MSQAKEEFVKWYTSAFLGSYAALNYDRNCQTGWKVRSQPVDDATRLAEEAWKQSVQS